MHSRPQNSRVSTTFRVSSSAVLWPRVFVSGPRNRPIKHALSKSDDASSMDVSTTLMATFAALFKPVVIILWEPHACFCAHCNLHSSKDPTF